MHDGLIDRRARLWLPLALILLQGHAAVRAQADPTAQATPKKAAIRESIYNKSLDANLQLEKALGAAKKDNKRVLLMFGGDWCGWCHKLHELFAQDPEIRKIRSYEYVTMMVAIESRNAAELLERCKAALSKEELQKGVGFPFLAVMDADGKIITAQRTDALEEGDHHDPKKVREFLSRWAVVPADARNVLKDALSQASSADKLVFLDFGAPWCGWCHELNTWINRPENAAILSLDFVVARIDIDRMTGGKDVMTQFRPDSGGGIPWYVILDSKGKALATADGPGGNIGYPFQPEEIDQFMALLQRHARHMDAAQLDQIKKSLADNAAQIKKASAARAPATGKK
jgi:thioredoxin-related protein